MRARLCSIQALLALVAWATVPASAQDFYAGKRLTVFVNYDVGGATDIEARLFSRHIGKHIAGNPTIIVQNMGGAAGLIGAKYLGEKAPRDGTMLGYFTAVTSRFAFNPEQFTVDLRNYEFVAYVPSGIVHFMRTDVKPGIKKPEDLAKAEGVIIGGLGADAGKDLTMRLTLEMLGVPHKYVAGYNSAPQVMLAMQRNEVNYFADSPPGYFGKALPGPIKEGQAIAVFFEPGYDGREFTVAKALKNLGGLPAFHELYQKVKGRMPQGPEWEAYLALVTINNAMFRTLTLPPEAPREAVAALQAAVLKLNNDPEFNEDARKIMGDAPEYVAGPGIKADVAKGIAIKPELKSFIEAFIAKAKK